MVSMYSRQKITLNTGYLSEQTNKVVKQLMLSEQIWITDSSTNNIEPVVLSSKNLVYKTHLTQKLIDYQFAFDLGYDEINKVV